MRRRAPGRDSASGQKRSSQNALCHGLARPASADFEAQIETLARQIAEDSVDPARLALARIASEAELELSQSSRARSLIFGALESPSHFRSDLEEIRWQIAEFEWLKALAEASPFCRSWLILPQLCPSIDFIAFQKMLELKREATRKRSQPSCGRHPARRVGRLQYAVHPCCRRPQV
jgi:hypothetical protein